MPRADFYLIDAPRFRADPQLLVCELALKAFEAGLPTVVLARSRAEASALDEKLWAFSDDAFVPHQLAGDEDDAECAVLIAPPDIEAPPRALVINLREACVRLPCETVKEVVPALESERAGSRQRWKEYQQLGWECRKFEL